MKRRKPLTKEQQQEILKEYRNGVATTEIYKKWGIHPPSLYNIVNKNGGQDRRDLKREKKIVCRVCGKVRTPKTHPKLSSWQGGNWMNVLTCGEWQCMRILELRPELRPKDAKPTAKHPKGCIYRPDSKYSSEVPLKEWQTVEINPSILQALYECEDNGERVWERVQDDIRCIDVIEAAQDFVWSPMYRGGVAVRTIGREGGEVSVTLRKRRKKTVGEAFIEAYFGGRPELAKGFQVLYAWRCACPEKTRFEWRALEDFQDEIGYYGACPRCGAVALEVTK